MKNTHRIFLLVSLILLLAACGGEPEPKYTLGTALLTETFDDPNAWEVYTSDGVSLQVVDGAYRVQTGDDGYIWGLNAQDHSDVVMEVEVSQLSTFENNAFGIMCRADTSNDGDGYYFMISGDGFYSIRKGIGEDVSPLVDWTESSAINGGQANNKIRAVCIGSYLAMYVNDKFLTETTDTDYANGYAGFAATAFDGGDTDLSFDNLNIWAATATATE